MVCSIPQDEAHIYGSLFYDYQSEGAARSARHSLPVVLNALQTGSVLDVGCGVGAWLAAYRDLGVEDCAGIDGDYVERSKLLIDQSRFKPADVGKPFDLGRKFDLVQCLEVAEHVPPRASLTLIENIVRHGKKVLFSAAVPGQGGENHINERPYEFWRDLFAAHGYRLFDFVRPRIAGIEAIEPWYRYNILFFAHDSVIDRLPKDVRDSHVGDRQRILDVSPVGYRLRKAILRRLSHRTVSRLAAWKHRRVVRALHRR